MKKSASRFTKLPVFPSMAACASATGIAAPILREANRAGCPAFASNHSVALEPLLRWLFSDERDDTATDWHVRYKRAQALAAELELSKDRGDVCDSATLVEQLSAAAGAMTGLIHQQIQEAPMALAAANGDVPKTRTILREILWAHHSRFRDAVSEHLRKVDDHTQAAIDEISKPEPS